MSHNPNKPGRFPGILRPFSREILSIDWLAEEALRRFGDLPIAWGQGDPRGVLLHPHVGQFLKGFHDSMLLVRTYPKLSNVITNLQLFHFKTHRICIQSPSKNSEQHWNRCPLSALSNSANLCLAPAKAAAQCLAVFWNMEWWSEYCRATTASCVTIIHAD